jgi:hypothetical protein
LTWVGDAVRVILAAERDGVLRPNEEGRRRLFRGEDLVPLPLVLAAGHVDGRPPKKRLLKLLLSLIFRRWLILIVLVVVPLLITPLLL